MYRSSGHFSCQQMLAQSKAVVRHLRKLLDKFVRREIQVLVLAPELFPHSNEMEVAEEENKQFLTFLRVAKLTWSANSVFNLSGKMRRAELVSPPPWILPLQEATKRAEKF